MSEALATLKSRMTRNIRIGQAIALADWDQQTNMPPGGSEGRAEQIAVLSEIAHAEFTADETGSALAQAERDLAGADPEGDDARMLRVVRRQFDLRTKIPAELVSELARHCALTQDIWVKARAANDFSMFVAPLEKMFDLVRREAECLGYEHHIYDALIDLYEPGATHDSVAEMFATLKPHLVDLVRRIADKGPDPRFDPIKGDFPVESQRALTLEILRQVGFDFDRGRQDVAPHPFCTHFNRDDVRLTTRFDPTMLAPAFYASLHEMGHGLYEQGSPRRLEGTALAGGTSLGVHESQSRLWENLVGRSRAFVDWVMPQLQKAFPAALGGVGADRWFAAVNRVEPSLIRVEADEVTYNLHIVLRFEIECDVLTGKLAVRDLPEAWNDRMQQYLGITPPDVAHGVLQDIHWSGGSIGYFPTYTIGNLLSAQVWAAAERDLGDLAPFHREGRFEPLLTWTREHIHEHGQRYLPDELVRKATGSPLTSECYVSYLQHKFGDLYGLN